MICERSRRSIRGAALVAAVLAAGATVAAAQPAPAPSPGGAPAPAETPEKRRARALLKEGVRLLNAGQPAEALELFRDAYQTFPSVALFLNIALAERALGRNADAANTFQRYLDAPDRDPTKVAGVEADLASLDRKVSRLRVTLDVTDGVELRVDGKDWFTPSPSGVMRLDPGAHSVAARRGTTVSADIAFVSEAGALTELGIELLPRPAKPVEPVEPARPVDAPPGSPPMPPDDPPAIVRTTPRAPGRLGAQAQVLVESSGQGAAGALAATFAATPRLDLIAGGIVGPSFGGFAAARFALTTGRVRPTLTGGVPVMVAEGTHVGVRGAAGVTWAFSRRASVIADVAAEYYPSPGTFYEPFMLVPSLGVHGRL